MPISSASGQKPGTTFATPKTPLSIQMDRGGPLAAPARRVEVVDGEFVDVPTGSPGSPTRGIPGTRQAQYSLPASTDKPLSPPARQSKPSTRGASGLRGGSAMGAAMGAAMAVGDVDPVRAATEDIAQKKAIAEANDAKYGPGPSGRFIDDYNGWDPQFNADPKALERMGYRDFGDAAADAAGTIFNGAKDAIQNAANHLPKIPNPFAPQPNLSNPGQAAPLPEFAEPPAKPKLGLNLPLAPKEPISLPYPPEGSAAPNSQSNRQNKSSDDRPVRSPALDPGRSQNPIGDPSAILESPQQPPPVGTPQTLGTAQQYRVEIFSTLYANYVYKTFIVTGPVTCVRNEGDGSYLINGVVPVQRFSLSWQGGGTTEAGDGAWRAIPLNPPPAPEPWNPPAPDPDVWPQSPPEPHIPASPNPSVPPIVGPQPSARPNAAPQGDPKASPKNKPQSPPAPGEPAPNIPDPLPGFPNFEPQGLPSPQDGPGLPSPTGNPSLSPNLAPSNPLTGSPTGDGSQLRSPDFPDPTTTTITTTKEGPQPRRKTDLSDPPTPNPPTPDRCQDPCINNLSDKLDEQGKKSTITVKIFKECKDGEPIYEDKSVAVPKGAEDFARLQFARIAELEGAKCSLQDPNLVIPEWWQVRSFQRPQLVVVYGELKGTKLTTSRWTLTIPHYGKPKGYKPRLPSYRRGNWEGRYTLSDNSKIIVNASNASECKKVINSLKINIPANLRNGATTKVGERRGVAYRNVVVVPISAKFFSQGQKSTIPDWTIKFR